MKVGVVLPIAQEDGTPATPSYAEVRAVAIAAETADLDSIWVFDHLRCSSRRRERTSRSSSPRSGHGCSS